MNSKFFNLESIIILFPLQFNTTSDFFIQTETLYFVLIFFSLFKIYCSNYQPTLVLLQMIKQSFIYDLSYSWYPKSIFILNSSYFKILMFHFRISIYDSPTLLNWSYTREEPYLAHLCTLHNVYKMCYFNLNEIVDLNKYMLSMQIMHQSKNSWWDIS